MPALPLVCHSSTPRPYAGLASVDASDPHEWIFRYRIEGEINRLLIPGTPSSGMTPEDAPHRNAGHPAFVDGLWKHTCFEAFIQAPGSHDYHEFNFSPSGDWALYRFDGYRRGMAAVTPARPPLIRCRHDSQRLDLEARVATPLSRGSAQVPSRLALSAVLEETDGCLSYWALAHPADKPDFHHPDGFTMTLPEETR